MGERLDRASVADVRRASRALLAILWGVVCGQLLLIGGLAFDGDLLALTFVPSTLIVGFLIGVGHDIVRREVERAQGRAVLEQEAAS